MSRDMYGPMTGASAWMMHGVWDTTHLVLLFAMWLVMMVGMMVPSAAPTLLLYAMVVRKDVGGGSPVARVYAFLCGYLLCWAGFSLAATALQRGLSVARWLSPMVESYPGRMTRPFASGTPKAAKGSPFPKDVPSGSSV